MEGAQIRAMTGKGGGREGGKGGVQEGGGGGPHAGREVWQGRCAGESGVAWVMMLTVVVHLAPQGLPA